MAKRQENEELAEKVGSISSKFLESLFTGKRDPMFRQTEESRKRESEEQSDEKHADSQRGTF